MKMGYALWVAAQWLIAPRWATTLRCMVRERMAPLGTGQRLDIGCGPRSPIAQTLPGTLVGVDCTVEMLRETRRDRVLCICASAVALPFAAKSFDDVVCFGVLHHLNEGDAGRALDEMRRVVRPAGGVLLFDSVTPGSAARRPLAALLRALDRGRHRRDETSLRRLLDLHGFNAGPRVTYSWTGLEGLWAILFSPPAGNS